MRKIVHLILFTFISYCAYSNATVAQKEWRWRKDNGTEATAEWLAGQNTAAARPLCNDENLRLRMAFQVNPDPANALNTATKNVNFTISYSTSPGGPFTIIPITATSEHFELATSEHVSDPQATSQRLISGSGYATGRIIDKSTVATIDFATPPEVITVTEHEWVIRPTANAQEITYYFRLPDLETYDALPQITFTASTVTASSVVTNVGCNGGSNGSINITPSGGTSPYTYDWGGGITTEDRTGLAAGSYNVTITDASGCEGTVNAIVTQPVAISASVSSTNVSCNGGSNGTATVTVTNGTAPYTYSWSPSGGTAATATGLPAGPYTVTITDNNTCTATKNVTITQPAAISASVSSTNVSCNGGSNGTATVTVTNGTAPYTYSWSPSGGTAATATGLPAGPYTVTITDNNTCTATKNVTIVEPAVLSASIVQDFIACEGSGEGTATVTASGGTGSMQYVWSPSGATSASATGLIAGQHTVTITDDNTCSITKTIDITETTCTGVKNPMTTEMSNKISVYPNPSAGEGIISIGNSGGVKILKVSLMDVSGRKITSSENTESLMIESLEAGIYMIEILTDKGVAIKKLLVR